MVRAFGWSLMHFVWEGAVVAGLLAVVLRVLRGRSAQLRYGVACGALALMVALSLVTFGYLAMTSHGSPSSSAEFAGPRIAMTGIAVGFEGTDSWLAESEAALDRILPWVLIAWCAGAVVFLARLNVGLVIARRMKSMATGAVSADLQRIFKALKVELGIARPVRLMQSAMVQVPTVIGWLRPVVLIPLGCLAGMSQVQIEAVFAHELAHIRRLDYLVSVLQSFVEAVLFYHPAVWWVSKQVRTERENCCDDVAIRASGDSLAYAKALSLLEEQRSSYPLVSLGANGGALVMRIRRLLGYKEAPAFSQFAGMTLLAVMVAVIALGIGALASGQSATEKTVAQEQAAGTHEAMPTVYRKWVDEDVLWIITTEETKQFMKLENNRERDEFIKHFWERRSQETPGGPRDTFRTEYYRRIAYANQHFAASAAGWKSDRGRIYILYGPPNSIDAHPAGGDGEAKPFELWHYNNMVQAHSAALQVNPGDSTTTFNQKDIDMKFIDICNCGNYQLQALPK
jgi:GWxTD domain-containing protein